LTDESTPRGRRVRTVRRPRRRASPVLPRGYAREGPLRVLERRHSSVRRPAVTPSRAGSAPRSHRNAGGVVSRFARTPSWRVSPRRQRRKITAPHHHLRTKISSWSTRRMSCRPISH